MPSLVVFVRGNGRIRLKLVIELLDQSNPQNIKPAVIRKARTIEGKVYLLTNSVNAKLYVGITKRSLEYRLKGHAKTAARGLGSPNSIWQAIRDHGLESFTIKLLDTETDPIDLAKRETHHIERLKTLFPNGYNQNRGGAVNTNGCKYIVEGKEFKGLTELADYYGVPEITMHKRMQSGTWTIEQACNIEEQSSPEQIGNRLNVDGREFQSITSACRHFGIDKRLFDSRRRIGWRVEEALEITKRSNPFEFSLGNLVFNSKKEACRHFNVNNKKIESRLRLGWSLEEAFEVVPRKQIKKPKIASGGHSAITVVVEGKTYTSISKAAKFYGLKSATVRYRLKSGWSISAAFDLESRPQNIPSAKAIKIDEKSFASMAEMCRYYSIDVSTFKFRTERSYWSVRQALGLDVPPSRSTKIYKVISPEGIIHIVDNFSSEQGWGKQGLMLQSVATKDKLYSWKGWKCRLLEADSSRVFESRSLY